MKSSSSVIVHASFCHEPCCRYMSKYHFNLLPHFVNLSHIVLTAQLFMSKSPLIEPLLATDIMS